MKQAAKTLYMWAKVAKRGEFEDGGVLLAEDYTQVFAMLSDSFGSDYNPNTVWVTAIGEEINSVPVSIKSFIRQQVLYLRKGDGSNARRRPFSDISD